MHELICDRIWSAKLGADETVFVESNIFYTSQAILDSFLKLEGWSGV